MLKPAIRLLSFEKIKLKIIIGNLLIKTSPNSIMYWPPTWLLSKKSFSTVDPDLFKILTCKTYQQQSIDKDIDKSLKGVKKFNEVKSSILKQFS